MTKQEALSYAQQLLKESGASEEEVTLASKLFEREKFANGFIPRPEVDRALDSERGKYRDIQARNEYLEKEWLPSAKQAEAQAKAVYSKFQKYQQLYGDVDEGDPASVRTAAHATGLTEAKVRELLTAELGTALASRDRATLDLMTIREDYMDRFKKRLPLDDFEKHVDEQRKRGNVDSLTAIYKDWIEPEANKLTPHRFSEDELKARDKRIREEAEKDIRSRHGLPVDAKAKEAHLLFDRDRLQKEKAASNGNGQSGREAFLQVLNDPDPDTIKQRYPV